MTVAEAAFKATVRTLVTVGIYPGPVQIRRALGRRDGSQTINGRQMRWRGEVLSALGWTDRFAGRRWRGERHRYIPPTGWQGRLT